MDQAEIRSMSRRNPRTIYKYISMSLTDDVGDIVFARQKRIPNIAFYDNSYASTCAIDGLRLDLVDGNVDRDFWSIRSGGVVRSLFTSLKHNSEIPARGFFDFASLYLDGELRKTHAHIAGYCVLKEQEWAKGGITNLSNHRKDLYKRISSGGPISRTPPYAKSRKWLVSDVC